VNAALEARTNENAFCKQNGDLSKYHYIVVRYSKQDSWNLEKAWRTDPADNCRPGVPSQFGL